MRFALNYSPEAVQLVADRQIEIDLYKLPGWPDLVRKVNGEFPLYAHFEIVAGSDIPVDWDFVEWALEHTETQVVNVHLGVWHAQEMPDADILDLSPEIIDTVHERMRRDLLDIVERFGPERVIAENTFTLDRTGKPMLACTLPEVVTAVIEETGCGLLLDTAHAKMAAFVHGMSAKDYVNQLPVDRLREVHVTGIGFRDDGRLGDHLPMRGDDWALYEWVMQQVHDNPRWRTPEIVACEYGGVGELFRLYSRADVIAEANPAYGSDYARGNEAPQIRRAQYT
jgi:uncharacterized protein (UPF0276 family)